MPADPALMSVARKFPIPDGDLEKFGAPFNFEQHALEQFVAAKVVAGEAHRRTIASLVDEYQRWRLALLVPVDR